jgi:hypothetical protein
MAKIDLLLDPIILQYLNAVRHVQGQAHFPAL